jgi:hypothetical protein
MPRSTLWSLSGKLVVPFPLPLDWGYMTLGLAIGVETSAWIGLKDFASAVSDFATAGAIVFGALWAFFRYGKDRTYRPRFDLFIDGGCVEDGDQQVLVLRVTVRNSGHSQIKLLREYSSVRLRMPLAQRNGLESLRWPKKGTAYRVFREHSWLESQETIRHDLAVALPADRPALVLADLMLKCEVRHRLRKRNVVVYTRKLIHTSTAWEQPNDERVLSDQ